MTCYLI